MKNEKFTEEEVAADERLTKIKSIIEELCDVCQQEPEASIILSLTIPSNQEDKEDAIMSLYIGDTITQVMQLDLLTKQNNNQFMHDLMFFLDYKIKQQMKKTGSTGSKLIDKILASISEENTKLN